MNTVTTLPTFTVGYAVRGPIGNEEILLGLKSYTPKAIKMETAGRRIGYGGGIEPSDRSVVAGFIREFVDETCDPTLVINPRDVRHVASLEMRHAERPSFQLEYLLLFNYTGTPKDHREMTDARWYPARQLPDNACGSDKILFPWLLSETMLFGWMLCGSKTSVLQYQIGPFSQ